MSDNRIIHLQDRAVLRLSGQDTITFLQGLLTRDIRKLSLTQALYALMLTPQGKFLYDMFLVQQEDAVLLDVAAATKDALLKKLTMYRLRSDVTLEDLSANHNVYAFTGAAPAGTFVDPRTPALGHRLITAEAIATSGTAEDYALARIRAGVPSPEDMADGFPLQFRMDDLNAVDFDKGCYVGQEVTTRSKHRGNIRKSVYVVEADNPLPEAGTLIQSNGRNAGGMLSHAGNTGLALLEKEAAAGTLTAEGCALRLILPR